MRPIARKSSFEGLARAAALLLVLGICSALTLHLNGYYVFVLANIALLALVGIGMNALIGLTGQISFGHVGFYAVGAYTVAILGKAGLSFWLAWPIGALIATALGALLALPALRVKGPYLAMITIAFGFIVEHAIVESRGLTGGQNGIMGIVSPTLGALARGERAVALIAFGAAALAYIAYSLLARGAWGTAMRALRDSEAAAESIGLNPLVIKTMAFALSAFCAGAAGGLFAPLSGFVTPHTFGFSQSILFVLVVMIGGAGAPSGPIVGAIIVGVMPELLSSLEDFRLLFFGALLLLVLWVAPGGMIGLGSAFLRALRGKLGLTSAQATIPTTTAQAHLPRRARAGLEASALSIQFGGVHAVSDLSFAAAPGAVTSLIGPNGAGKTTALNMLSGFYRPSSGTFFIGKKELGGAPAMRIARAGLARTYQTSQLFGSLSVVENVMLAAARGRLGMILGSHKIRSAETLALGLLAYCGYAGDPASPSADLAHVDRRIVEIARALALDPDILLLDEPAAGLSTQDKEKLALLLRRLADAGLTVILVEHDMTLVMGISDAIVVLDAGKRIAMGAPAEIQLDPAVRKAYLGESEAAGTISVRRKPSPPSQEILGISGVFAGYGAAPVLQGIDIQVRRNEVVALLGANGAGKSTLMRLLSGLHRPALAGGITLDGADITNLPAEKIVRLGMVLSPEGRQVFPELSVLDNIRLGAFTHPEGMDARVDDMLTRFPRLRERLHQRAGLLSGGEQQMLAVARALMSKPRILLLDEPSLGLAPKIVADLFAALERLREDEITVLLVDQMAGLALKIADRAYVIEGGCIIASGTADEIAGDPALARAYLGG